MEEEKIKSGNSQSTEPAGSTVPSAGIGNRIQSLFHTIPCLQDKGKMVLIEGPKSLLVDLWIQLSWANSGEGKLTLASHEEFIGSFGQINSHSNKIDSFKSQASDPVLEVIHSKVPEALLRAMGMSVSHKKGLTLIALVDGLFLTDDLLERARVEINKVGCYFTPIILNANDKNHSCTDWIHCKFEYVGVLEDNNGSVELKMMKNGGHPFDPNIPIKLSYNPNDFQFPFVKIN